MNWGWVKSTLVKIAMWALRTLIREGKEEIAKFAVADVLEDSKIPHVNDVATFVRKNFPVRTGRRGM